MYTKEQRQAFLVATNDFLKNPKVPSDAAQQSIFYEKLVTLLQYHEWCYYVQHNSVISDFEYDQLFLLLKKMEAQHPELTAPHSPTQRAGSDITADFPAVPHLKPMLSLENSYDAADLLDFDARIRKLLSIEQDADIEYCVEPKYDGGTIALLYENDVLVRGATRGDGIFGEEITANVKAIRAIPLQARFSEMGISKAELRGEAIIRKDVFQKVNQQREEEGKVLLANARNAATGCLRVKESAEVKRRGVEAFIYQVSAVENAAQEDMMNIFEKHSDTINLLGKWGFKIPSSEWKVCKNIAEVVNFCSEWEEKRDNYGYEIDGMVVKVNRIDWQEKCGYTSHHPRWAIAYKFKARQAITKLLAVEYQVGKIGSITPVAKLKPVQLAGVTVSSVSLHNEDFINARDLHIGDSVLVERAGDVIPYIVRALEDERTGNEQKIIFPQFCPLNEREQVPLVRMEGEAAWRCPNCTCGSQTLQRLIFHVSKDGMDIEGFGKSILERFFEMGWIHNLADIYRLDYEKIKQLEGFGEKSADNLKKSIEKAKQNPLYQFLQSLSIHHLGKKAARLLAAEVSDIFELAAWAEQNYLSIKEIGPVVAQNAMAFFQNPDNIALLRELETLGVNLKATDADKKKVNANEGILAGKSILFTGSLQHFKREEAEKLAESAGAKVLSGVSAKLSILVVGAEAGSKLDKAKALGTVQILTEEQFIELISPS